MPDDRWRDRVLPEGAIAKSASFGLWLADSPLVAKVPGSGGSKIHQNVVPGVAAAQRISSFPFLDCVLWSDLADLVGDRPEPDPLICLDSFEEKLVVPVRPDA